MKQYLDLLRDVRENGEERTDRTGVGTYGVFGRQIRFDLSDGFPILTTKKIHWKSVAVELLWFLKGDTNAEYLHKYGVSIWDEWILPDGTIGDGYGKQWRKWETKSGKIIDQISLLMDGLKKNPYGRRHIVTAWNPGDLETMALPPCHCLFQFYVQDGRLSCQLYQRSADIFLGVPFNISSYSMLLMMLCDQLGYLPGEFIHTFGDLHLYKNHVEQADLQLSRTPRDLPELKITPNVKSIFDYQYEDFELVGYDPMPGIKAPVAV
jgi:thymidylate synthase